MTDRKTPVEQALDLFVYAPIGLALTAAEELPKLVEKGKDVVTNRTAMYRMIGKYAVDQGQRTAERFVRSRAQPAPPPARAAAPSRPTPARAPETPTEPVAGNGQRPPAPSSDDLAIPGYDALSASQVVQRLAGLAPDELEQVRAYEAATRGRKTILSRVAQLQSGG